MNSRATTATARAPRWGLSSGDYHDRYAYLAGRPGVDRPGVLGAHARPSAVEESHACGGRTRPGGEAQLDAARWHGGAGEILCEREGQPRRRRDAARRSA